MIMKIFKQVLSIVIIVTGFTQTLQAQRSLQLYIKDHGVSLKEFCLEGVRLDGKDNGLFDVISMTGDDRHYVKEHFALMSNLPPLHQIILNDSLPSEDANLNGVLNDRNWTLLILAAAWNDENLVQYLLSNNVNLEQKDCYGYTALQIASMSGNSNIVKLLVQAGANTKIKAGKNKVTILHLAAESGNAELISFLIEHCGFNPNVRTKYDRRTPMIYAVKSGNIDAVKCLLIHNAYIHGDNGDINLYYNNENSCHYYNSIANVVASFLIQPMLRFFPFAAAQPLLTDYLTHGSTGKLKENVYRNRNKRRVVDDDYLILEYAFISMNTDMVKLILENDISPEIMNEETGEPAYWTIFDSPMIGFSSLQIKMLKYLSDECNVDILKCYNNRSPIEMIPSENIELLQYIEEITNQRITVQISYQAVE